MLNVASVDDALRGIAIDGARRFMETAAQIGWALEDARRHAAASGPAAPPNG